MQELVMRILCFMLVSAAVCTSSAAYAEEAYTTRIEPRPYYGAVVTIEHGVRVYRPVPATRHMIIDPAAAGANATARTELYGPVAPAPAVPRDR
jgi:hypothetical protein